MRVASASSDELAKLVADFNQMASELQRQRASWSTQRIEAGRNGAPGGPTSNPLTPSSSTPNTCGVCTPTAASRWARPEECVER